MSLFLLLSTALASPADFYGFGGKTIGQGGGGVAAVNDSSACFLNPAGLSQMDQPELLYGASIIRFNMPDLPDLHWDTNRDGTINSSDPALKVDPTPDPADGAAIAFSTPVLDRFHVGAALFLPFSHLTRFQTFDPAIPTYFMLENRLHRYALAMAGSVELPHGLSFGLGARFLVRSPLAIHFTLSAGVSAEDAAAGEDEYVDVEVDVHAIDLRLKADAVPTFGLLWDLGETSPVLEGLRFGISGRGEASMDIDVVMDGQINASLEDAGTLEDTALALIYYSKVQILDHFLPRELQVGLAYSPNSRLDTYLDARFTQYSRMEINVAQTSDAVLEATLADLSASGIGDGNPLDLGLEDTLSFRTGLSLRFPEWELGRKLGKIQLTPRGGFGFVPSPLESQSTDSALLDSDRLVFALGLGAVHQFEALGQSRRLEWDVYGQMHQLASGQLARPSSDPLVAGTPIDSDSVPIGGRVFIAGAQTRFQY